MQRKPNVQGPITSVQAFSSTSGAHQCGHLVQKGERGRVQQQPQPGNTLLLPQRQHVRPVCLNVQAASALRKIC